MFAVFYVYQEETKITAISFVTQQITPTLQSTHNIFRAAEVLDLSVFCS